MGYNTRYRLKVVNEGPERNESYDMAVYSAKDPSDESYIEYLLDHKYLFNNSESRWHDMDKDMKKISGQYPGVLFIVTGEGEEAGDLWRSYFKNGKSQYAPAVLTYPEFDESLLR